jgi:hypothetical protein
MVLRYMLAICGVPLVQPVAVRPVGGTIWGGVPTAPTGATPPYLVAGHYMRDVLANVVLMHRG